MAWLSSCFLKHRLYTVHAPHGELLPPAIPRLGPLPRLLAPARRRRRHRAGRLLRRGRIPRRLIFWTGADPNRSPMNPSTGAPCPNPTPSPAPLSRAGFRRLAERNFGILAALADDDKKWPTAKAAAASVVSTSSLLVSTSPSSASTSGRMISAVPKPKPELALSMPEGKIYHRSAPVNVPVAPSKVRRGWGEFHMDHGDSDGDEEMLPPHEIVARQLRSGTPMNTFSVLEGVGRTLKGRDLRRVRNAVLQKTGFLD